MEYKTDKAEERAYRVVKFIKNLPLWSYGVIALIILIVLFNTHSSFVLSLLFSDSYGMFLFGMMTESGEKISLSWKSTGSFTRKRELIRAQNAIIVDQVALTVIYGNKVKDGEFTIATSAERICTGPLTCNAANTNTTRRHLIPLHDWRVSSFPWYLNCHLLHLKSRIIYHINHNPSFLVVYSMFRSDYCR